MAAKCTIRNAEQRDFGPILRLACLIAEAGDTFPWEGFEQGVCKEEQAEQTAMLSETWLPDPGQCRQAFVCEVEEFEGIAGVYILQPKGLGRCRHVAQGAYMVDPTLRGQGLGKQLCRHSLEEARRQKYAGMQFDMVVSTNVAAIKAWTACGFKIMCTLPRVFQHPEEGFVDAHVMFNDFSSAEFSDTTAKSSYTVGDKVHILPQPSLPSASASENVLNTFKVEPPLPEGLTLCPLTGAIQGTPLKPSLETTYRITTCSTSTVTFQVIDTVKLPSGESLNIDEDFAARVENVKDLKQMPKEPARIRAFGDWMIWMVHRAWLNDPTLIDVNFDGKHMPAPHIEPRIAPKLAKAMASNTHLKVLSLSNANVQKSTAIELAEALRLNCIVQTLNLDSNCLDSNSIREIALSIKDNPNTCIEHLRLQHQVGMGVVFGRPAEEAVGQMMQRNKTVVNLGFECSDAHWRNLIDRALILNNDVSRRRRSQCMTADVEADSSPIEERTLNHLVLQGSPVTAPSDFFSEENCCHALLRAYMVHNLQLPTTVQLQNYAKNSGEPIQHKAAVPLIKEFRSRLLDNALSSEVSVVDAFGTTTMGNLKAWQEHSIDLCNEAGERLIFKAPGDPPGVFLSSAWTPWLKRTKSAASLAGA